MIGFRTARQCISWKFYVARKQEAELRTVMRSVLRSVGAAATRIVAIPCIDHASFPSSNGMNISGGNFVMSSSIEESSRFVKRITYIFIGFGAFMVVAGLAMAFIDPGALFLCVFGAVFAGIGYLVHRGFAVPKGKMAVILSSSPRDRLRGGGVKRQAPASKPATKRPRSDTIQILGVGNGFLVRMIHYPDWGFNRPLLCTDPTP